MKRLFLILGLLFSVCVSAQIDKIIPPRPSPPKLVNDFTGTLTPYEVKALEDKLVAYDDSTSNQIAVVILPTIGNYSVEEVGLEIIRRWGVGNKDINNGIVLLIAKNDRKLRIEVGNGLEGVITDVTAKNIIENEIRPNFRQDNYYKGIDQGTDAIIKAAAGEYKAPANYGSKKSKGFPKGGFIAAIILFIIFSIIFGGSSGSGGTYVSSGGFGGWSGGGGSSGWSGGGGGFGGFGGGGSGGGGASGSW